MPKISANLGFLWADLPLPQRIERAAAAGFTAVEFHYPYEHDAKAIAALLTDLNLQMVGLNTGLGSRGQGEFGVAALPGREAEAVELIDQAIAYARQVDANYVSVVAGRVSGPDAGDTFQQNLSYACSQASQSSIQIVIEPLSAGALPGYFLNTVEQAISIIDSVGAANLKVMFDCFHIQSDQGGLTKRLHLCGPKLGHVQIASVPDRAEPNTGEVDYRYIFSVLDEIGYEGWVGAEYHPAGTVEEGLRWLREMA